MPPAWARRRNPLRERMRAGEPAVALWVTTPWAAVAEILGAAGAHGALVDLEHTSMDVGDAERLITAADAAGISALVRPWVVEPGLVSRLLDAGAHGIVFPHVDDAADAAVAVACLRYPPDGRRGWGGAHTRFALWEGGYAREQFQGGGDPGVYTPEYVRAAHEHPLCVVIVESLRGVANVEEIVATDGIDAVVFGWGDLSAEVGFDAERCRAAAREVDAACRAAGVGQGLGPGEDSYPGCFTIAGIDSLLMSAALRGAVHSATIRDAKP